MIMKRSLTLLSPAKVNLFLKVVNKRPDGFHNIETLFERIDLCDKLRFSSNATGKIVIACNHPQVPLGPKNLVYQVAQILKNDCGIKKGVKIDIDKKIPVAAGLAGGSSNAAYTLLGLNELWQLKLSKRQLISYAQQIGSDVAFFLADCSFAYGTQKGDQISKVNLKKKLWHVLVVPRVKVYSKVVYGGLKLQLTKKSDDVNILIHSLRKNKIKEVYALLRNDLEAVVMRFCPQVLRLKKRLKLLHFQGFMVSGSGPSVFSLMESEQEAKLIAKKLAKVYSQVFVVQTF